MRQKTKNIALSAAVMITVLVCIVFYSGYTRQQICRESTANLLSTYSQVTKTFNMFVQRNWNVLEVWGKDLEDLDGDPDASRKWRTYVEERATWQYSEAVLFNEENQYWTVGGRQGDAPHMKAALAELYASDGPIVTSYISSKGVRKVMFAMQVQPITIDGVTYTSLALCYDNTTLENLLGGLAYEGQSDCYIVRTNGDVVLSTEPRTVIPEQLTNLFDYLEDNTETYQIDFSQTRSAVQQKETGGVAYDIASTRYYLVYQPVGVKDWSIIGVVPASAVESGMNAVQANTILLLLALFAVILFGMSKIFYDEAKMRRERAEAEKQELQRRKEIADEMFEGMARLVDRFAICDLDTDRYEDHERKKEDLYPPEGSFRELREEISRKYVALTDGENAKLTRMLSPENLRAQLKTPEDALKLEYAARDKSAFLMMTVVPCGWEEGRLTRVMIIAQDMGRQHLLQELANTDALTGLLNKRYFDAVVGALERRGQAFALFYLDLDRFKPVNDTYGHAMGDRLLQEVGKRLQGCIRGSDYAFRLGGDEFALLLVGELSAEDCRRKATKVGIAVAEVYQLDGNDIFIGTSCGWSLFPSECPSAEQARLLADKRMYADKQRRHALYDHGLRAD